ncbi:MAG: response regulator [Mariprofundaceae bacterium]|nr:response regulator [Mariprofundaceae bacterium]
MKILIVEDNPANMKLACTVLAKAGYETLEATDAETAIQLARNELPSLILMDIQLPGMDGLTATRLLKGDQDTRDIKIIALTAFAMKGDEQKILSAGCDGYIAKPIRYKEFLKTVESFLSSGSDRAA